MGSGKTTIGRLVAERLNRPFIDTDEYIEERFGSAASILNQSDGDEKFGLVEEEIARELAGRSGLVIGTGGRFLINQTNIDVMKRNGEIVCLSADLNTLVQRLLNSNTQTFRPRFTKAEDKLALMQELQKQSQPFLNQFKQVDISSLKPQEGVEKIIDWFC